jgi:hypothetical protein
MKERRRPKPLSVEGKRAPPLPPDSISLPSLHPPTAGPPLPPPPTALPAIGIESTISIPTENDYSTIEDSERCSNLQRLVKENFSATKKRFITFAYTNLPGPFRAP